MVETEVSVVVPVRNAAPFITEAVGSALDQGDLVGEILVVDDGSTDGSGEAVGRFSDRRVRLLSNPGRGVSSARNHGISQAAGRWILFLDADDRLVPSALVRLVAAADDEAVAIYGDYDRIDGQGRRIGVRHLIRNRRSKPTGDILEALLAGNFIAGGCTLIRRTALNAVGGYDPSLALCEDWLLWCRLAALGPFIHVPALHVLDYRVHGQSTMHRRALTFAELAPVLDRIFTVPAIRARLPAARLQALRGRAEASLRAYVATEAARLGTWPVALAELAWAARRLPSALPRLAVRLAASIAGI